MTQQIHRSRNPERTIPAVVRRAVIARDGMTCQRCQAPVVRVTKAERYRPDALHLDHVIHWASGGENTEENLIVCCADCNLRRPKPVEVIRNAHVGIDYRNGTHYWSRPDFTPPKSLNRSHDVRSIKWTCEYLGVTTGHLLSLILGGHFGSSGGTGPIRVGLPREFSTIAIEREDAAERAAEKAREHAAVVEGWKRTVSAERAAAKPPAKATPPDPERVDYWRQVIAESRAARKAAREARGR